MGVSLLGVWMCEKDNNENNHLKTRGLHDQCIYIYIDVCSVYIYLVAVVVFSSVHPQFISSTRSML